MTLAHTIGSLRISGNAFTEAGLAACWRTAERSATRLTVPTKAGDIVYRRWACPSPSRDTLILVHGGSGNWLHWMPVIPLLVAHRDVVALDLPGFGESARAPHRDLDEIAQGLLAVLSDLACDTPSIAAFSFGAVVAAVALASSSAHIPVHLLAPAGLGRSHLPENLLRGWRSPNAEVQLAIHRQNLAGAMTTSRVEIVASAVEAYAQGIEAARFDSRAASFSNRLEQLLPKLTLRSALWAERDAFMAPDIARRVALVEAAHPRAQQRIVPGSGHWLQLDAPDAVVEWLAPNAA